MIFNKESDFEEALIKILSEKGWEKEVLKNYSEQDLLQNWANILFENNRDIDRLNDYPLTDGEMQQILEQIKNLRTPLKLNGFINGKSVSVIRDNVLKELKQSHCFQTEKRRALTRPEQELLLSYLKNTPSASLWYLYFGAGGALGFDTIAAFAVLKLKERYPDIRLILVLPCFSQTRGWSQEDIEIYDDIKQKADKVVYTSQEYTRGCMHKRNRHLVDNSSACISYLTENKGGTFYTVNYAKSKGVEVINIAE